MSKIESDLALPQILSRLMADKGLKERDVVKSTGLTQYNVSNILRGRSKNPSLITLKALAELFGITIGQLVGYENLESKLPSTAARSSLNVLKPKPLSLAPLIVPIVRWSEVKGWLSGKTGIKAHSAWIVNDACKSPKAFALKVKPSMRSQFFSANATLLVDPEALIEDGKTVLVFLDDAREPSIRIFTVDGKEKRLQPLEKALPSIALTSDHVMVGPVVEVRYTPGP